MNTTVGIIDFGVGNLRNIQKAIESTGFKAIVSGDLELLEKQDKLIFPGVGAFASCMQSLDTHFTGNLIPLLKDKPVLGICIGLQVLFDTSEEHGKPKGLGMVSGSVEKIKPRNSNLIVPHVGWNQVEIKHGENDLFYGIPNNSYFYFTHSYCANPKENVITSTVDYGEHFCASIQQDNIYATQFHPEKSQDLGLQILKNFMEKCG